METESIGTQVPDVFYGAADPLFLLAVPVVVLLVLAVYAAWLRFTAASRS